jgi:hypothetical protein
MDFSGARDRANMAFQRNVRNSSFLDRELNLTTRGMIGGLGSIANDFGFNRRISGYGEGGKPVYGIDSFFGSVTRGGEGYIHPLLDSPGKVKFGVSRTLEEATAKWGQHIRDTAKNETGFMKLLTGARAKLYEGVGGGDKGKINMLLARAGGAGSLIAPTLTGVGAAMDFREGYRDGGVLGGAVGAATGYAKMAIVNKMIAGVLTNPIAGLTGGAVLAGTMYSAYKVLDVRNQGSNYLKMGRMQGLSWNRGATPGMDSQQSSTIRQRSLVAMQNSRFNAMRAMGNESYMMSAPRSRYANSTAIYNQSPMLSY